MATVGVMAPYPMVANAPLVNGGTNPFIDEGEFYDAGQGDWNPWGSRFPGDDGLVEAQAFKDIEKEVLKRGVFRSRQESFHLFVQCGKHPGEPQYQGPHARGKYMYMGRYRRKPQSTDDDVQEGSSFQLFPKIGPKTQFTMADWIRQHSHRDEDIKKLARPEWANQFRSGVDYLGRASELVANWDELNHGKRETHAWVLFLSEVNYAIEIVPVESVAYEEDLYRALVDSGASCGHVSIDYYELGPM